MSLAVVLMLLSATPKDAPVREPEPASTAAPSPLAWPNYVVPVLETAGICFGLLAFSNLITHKEFALITDETMKRNMQLSSWTIDRDFFSTNQLGHGYNGSLTFNAARSAGLSFWWSALYSTVTSLVWEVFFESEAPSVGDQLTTPIAGSFLGEPLHRAAIHLRNNDGPRWLNLLGAWLLDPFGGINQELLGPSTQRTVLDPLFVRFRFGANAHLLIDQGEVQRLPSPPQALAGVLLVSGAPWNSQTTYDTPFSYFDLRADLTVPFKVGVELFVRGMLVGQRFGTTGAWGLFGIYDYAASNGVRASGVGIGPGVVFQAQPIPGWYLQTVGAVTGSPFAAAGYFPVQELPQRDYHVGVGMQASLDLRLIRPQRLQLELTARHWLVVGSYVLPNGFEAVTWVTVAATIPLWRWLGLGADFTLSNRRAVFENVGSATNLVLATRVFLSVMSEPHFGIR